MHGHLPPIAKTIKLSEPDMRDTAGEVGTNSKVTYFRGPLHMDEQRKDDKLEPTYNSSVTIQDVALKTCRKQWTIEKGQGEGQARHDGYDVPFPQGVSPKESVIAQPEFELTYFVTVVQLFIHYAVGSPQLTRR